MDFSRATFIIANSFENVQKNEELRKTQGFFFWFGCANGWGGGGAREGGEGWQGVAWYNKHENFSAREGERGGDADPVRFSRKVLIENTETPFSNLKKKRSYHSPVFFFRLAC